MTIGRVRTRLPHPAPLSVEPLEQLVEGVSAAALPLLNRAALLFHQLDPGLHWHRRLNKGRRMPFQTFSGAKS